MVNCGLVDLSYDEMLAVDGGIGSAEIMLVAGLCLASVSAPWAAVVVVVAYANTKVIENCIDY